MFRAELPVSVQLFSVPPIAPPPNDAELPLSLQLFSVQPAAPPPTTCRNGKPLLSSVALAELLVSVQLFRVPPSAPHLR